MPHLDHADAGPDGANDAEELSLGGHVDGDTEVGPLASHELEEIACGRVSVGGNTGLIGEGGGGGHGG